MKIVMFHQNRIDLDREIHNHSKLMERLANHPADEFEIRLAEIASYCEVLLHGDYTPDDLDKLCGILFKRLLEKRIPIILTSIPPLNEKEIN